MSCQAFEVKFVLDGKTEETFLKEKAMLAVLFKRLAIINVTCMGYYFSPNKFCGQQYTLQRISLRSSHHYADSQ